MGLFVERLCGRGLEGVHPGLGIAVLIHQHIPGAHAYLQSLPEAREDVLLFGVSRLGFMSRI